MEREDFQALLHDSPMPGQAWSLARGTLPSERPSEFSSVEDFLDQLFSKLVQPEQSHEFLAIASAGVPIDTLVEALVQGFYGEGKINANMVAIVVPPLIVMLMRMAEAAGIDVKLSTDGAKPPIPETALALKGGKLTNNKRDKAINAGNKSRDLANLPKSMGLMSRPEGVV